MQEVTRFITFDGVEHKTVESAWEYLDRKRDEALGAIIDMVDKGCGPLGPKAKLRLHKYLVENCDDFVAEIDLLKTILNDFVPKSTEE